MVIIQYSIYFWGCFGIKSESWIGKLLYCLIFSTEYLCNKELGVSLLEFCLGPLLQLPLPPGNVSTLPFLLRLEQSLSCKEDSIFIHILAEHQYGTLQVQHLDPHVIAPT